MQDPAGVSDLSLMCAFFGGPRDGLKSSDLPTVFSGKKLTGIEMRIPLGQPAEFSLVARYRCTSETQVNGFWRFDFIDLTGPKGERLVAGESADAAFSG